MIPEDVFADLRKIASLETEAWGRLELILEEEKQALRRKDLSSITNNTIQKEMAMNGVRSAAEGRRKFMAGVHSRLGAGTRCTMEDLFGQASDDQRQEMSAWQAKFASYAASIEKLNTENIGTIKVSLEVVRDSIRFLNSIVQPVPTYTSGGYITAHTLQGRILSKRG